MKRFRIIPRNAAGRIDPDALGYAGWHDRDLLAGNPVIIRHAEPLTKEAWCSLMESSAYLFPRRRFLLLPSSVVSVDVRWQEGAREGRYSYRIVPVDSYKTTLAGQGDFAGQQWAVRVVPRHPWGARPIVAFTEDYPPIEDRDALREAVGQMIVKSLGLSLYIVARMDREFARAQAVGQTNTRPTRNRPARVGTKAGRRA